MRQDNRINIVNHMRRHIEYPDGLARVDHNNDDDDCGTGKLIKGFLGLVSIALVCTVIFMCF